MKIEDFIKQHNHHGYCEAILLPNGDIHYAVRGHTNDLISVSGKPKQEIDKMMPHNASPLHWLVCYTKCISVWYNFFIYNAITNEQRNTIQTLVNHGILANVVDGKYTDELERCDILNKYYNGEIEELNIPDRPKDIHIWRESYESKCKTN